MFWCNARSEEAQDLCIGSVVDRGASLQVNIKKCKRNQDRRLQVAYIHPNSSGEVGNFCPVKVLKEYVSTQKKFFHTNSDDYMFPNFNSVFDLRTKKQVISLVQPVVPMKYDNYRNHLGAL